MAESLPVALSVKGSGFLQKISEKCGDLGPGIGQTFDTFYFMSREVRRLLVGHYEMRYELQESNIYILRVWHTRENR